jgi:hypothetical protein
VTELSARRAWHLGTLAARTYRQRMTTVRQDHAVTRHGFLVGTPFCGSTVFGQALGAHTSMSYLGEVDRAVRFGPSVWAENPDPSCHYCELNDQSCPLWTEERLQTARSLPHGKLMPYFAEELGGAAVVDGSKHPHWLRAVLADQPADPEATVVFLTARSPFAFCDSYRFRTGCGIWEAANVWRDVYYDSQRMLNRARLPHMIVRYEDFALNPEPVLRSACGLLGVDYEPQMRFFQGQPGHDIGGNYSARAVARDAAGEFSTEEFRGRLPGGLAPFMEAAESYWGKPFGGWVDDKWQRNMTEDDIEFVLQTPGLVDVANLLGYELGSEVLAWSRREAAEPAEAPEA